MRPSFVSEIGVTVRFRMLLVRRKNNVKSNEAQKMCLEKIVDLLKVLGLLSILKLWCWNGILSGLA